MATDRHHNVPELAHLPADKRAVVALGVEAILALKRTFEHWMTIGRGVAILRAEANAIGGRKTFHRLLQRAGYVVLLRRSQSGITRLLQIIAREPEVIAWRATLTEQQRWAWAAPTAIFKHCPLFAPGKPRRAHPAPRMRLEVALDAVLDHLHDMDADNRRAVIERILAPFDLRLATKATSAPAAKRQKAAKARLRLAAADYARSEP